MITSVGLPLPKMWQKYHTT